MSKTLKALHKADAERRSAEDGKRSIPDPRPPAGHPAHLQYEKIRVWLKSPSHRENRTQAVMVVACHSGEGASTTAALLATTLAEGRLSRVLLMDTNFRTPRPNFFFRVRENGALEDIAKGLTVSFEPKIRSTDRQNLFVLTCEQLPGCPLEAFEGEEIVGLVTEMKRHFDFVVFDAPPVLEYPDSYALAPKVDGIILVAESDRTLIDDAQRGTSELARAGGTVLGVVLNRHVSHLPRFLQRFFATP